MDLIILAAGLCALLFALYHYLTSRFGYWHERGVKGPKPVPLFGNFKDLLLGKVHIAELIQRYYNEYKSERVIGIYGRSQPTLIVRDLDLIKDVLIKDFAAFSDRGMYASKGSDQLNQHLVNLEYERWRPLRARLSPVFTSGRLRDMFYLMLDCAESFEAYLAKVAQARGPTEMRDLTAKFTTEAIGVCVFGLNTNSLGDGDSEFRKHGRALFATDPLNVLRGLLREFSPTLYELLGPLRYSKSIRFVINSMQATLEYRRKTKVRRNDFVDLLMDLQAEPEKLSNIEFNDLFLTGQALVFFAAGFETSSTTMSNTLYELALNHDIQSKLRQEIRKEIEKDGGRMTYDSIKRMKYLNQVVKETLRKYPPGSVLQRQSNAPYTFAGTKLSISKDIKVLIPVWGIQRDPEIYPDPEAYDPERFSEENEKSRHPMAYLPFGDGPHNCIGARFANYQTKMGIIAMINKFKVDVCEKTCIPYRLVPRSMVITPVGGIYLKISKAD